MQSCDLVELAALVSAQVPVLLAGAGRITAVGIDAYWAASKCRFDRWARRLNSALATSDRTAKPRKFDGPIASDLSFATCCEVLTSEVLTRVWAAAAMASDAAASTSELGPVTQSILFGHLEARRRVLDYIAAVDKRRPEREAKRPIRQLDQLRRICERWTDLLLAPLADWCDLESLAHDASRVTDFAQDRADDRDSEFDSRARAILAASLRVAFRRTGGGSTGNADLNADVAAAILRCLNLEQLEAAGVELDRSAFGWLFLARVAAAAQAAEQMVADLLGEQRNV